MTVPNPNNDDTTHRARAAIDAPALFSSIILAEPAIVPYPRSGPVVDDRAFPYVVNAIKRESRWSSR